MCNDKRSDDDDGASQTKDLKFFKSGGHPRESSDRVSSGFLKGVSSPRSAKIIAEKNIKGQKSKNR